MARRITADRKRLHQRRLALDTEGFLYVEGLRVARYLPDTGVLQFEARRADRNEGAPRMVEVTLLELVKGLSDGLK